MMTLEEELFAEATKLPASEREGFVRESCDDDSLRERLLRLLSAHESGNVFLDAVEAHSAIKIQGVAEGDEIGPYRLLQKLGEGGFGIVYMAQQQTPIERKVAIKIIKPGMDSRAVIARFEGERQALAMMEHPNIACVFDGGASDNGQRPYFVMELVQGVPITNYCDANCLSTRDRLQLFISVCNAVHHAHQKGIIHRDIKPSNVMVTLHDGKPVVKVIDFGVAKALHQRLTDKTLSTQYGTMVGTPQYMSPEQAEMSGLDVDTRSDIYSLSVLLYELITGTTPLDAHELRSAGLQAMEHGFRQILHNRGYDLDTLSPEDVASRLRTDHAPIKLTDALELWLATRMKLDDIGSKEVTTDEIQRWTDAMSVADPNRLRNAIRATIFRTANPDRRRLDDAVSAADLSVMCARKLSWLAQAFNQVGDTQRATEIRDYALALHSSDMMLNFEHAVGLMAQDRADEAIGYFMRCTSIRPRNSAVWQWLAEAHRQNDELQQSRKTIKIAIDLDPYDAGSHLSLSKWQLEDGLSKKAIDSAERAIALDERVNTSRQVIGRANMELGQYSKALIAFEEFQNRSAESESDSVNEWIAECQKRIGSGQ